MKFLRKSRVFFYFFHFTSARCLATCFSTTKPFYKNQIAIFGEKFFPKENGSGDLFVQRCSHSTRTIFLELVRSFLYIYRFLSMKFLRKSRVFFYFFHFTSARCLATCFSTTKPFYKNQIAIFGEKLFLKENGLEICLFNTAAIRHELYSYIW
jgi:hypothetical protein